MKYLKVFIYFQLTIIWSASVCFADDPIIRWGETNTNTIIELDRSGVRPRDGRHGLSYEGQRARGGTFSGDSGDHARHGEPGENVPRATDATTGTFFLNSTTAGVLTLSGSFVSSSPNQTVEVKIRDNAFIRPIARGGDGARPGNGGFGESGGHGEVGYAGSGNQQGGPGGDGGNAGRPARSWNGGDAGNGRNLPLGIPLNQMELGWPIESDLRGGVGGDHGVHGRAGQVGQGAAGGPGGFYQVPVEVPTTEQVQNSDGTTRTVHGTKTVMETRQAPSGSWGTDGDSQSEISIPLYKGKDGTDGQETWRVYDENGDVVYEADDRYQLNLVGFNFGDTGLIGEELDRIQEQLSELTDDAEEFKARLLDAAGQLKTADLIFEPEELAYVTNIFVRNTGQLPTPSGAKTRLKIKSGQYYVSDEITFDLPEGLKPGELALVKDTNGQPLKIPFKVKDFSHLTPSEEPFVKSETITPVGEADVAQTTFTIPEFNLKKGGNREFTVQYPILIEPVITLPSLAPGEASKHIVKITNISGRDFGAESELKRHLELFIQRSGGDLTTGEHGIEFFNSDGTPLDINEGILKKVMRLRAGESTLIETIVGLSPAAESYKEFDVSSELRIDRVGRSEGEDLQAIQRRGAHVRVTDNYFKTPDSDFLLVTNNRLEREEYVALKNTIEGELNSSMDVWPITTKNFITFLAKLGEYNEESTEKNGYEEFQESLAESFKGKTIILLANQFESARQSNNGQNIWDFIKIHDLRGALALHGVNLYVVKGEATRMSELHFPRNVVENNIEYSSFNELRSAVRNQEGIVMSEADPGAEKHYWETSMSGMLTSRQWLLTPWESFAKRKARKLYKDAIAENPDADFQAVHRFAPSRIHPTLTPWERFRPFGSLWSVGEIQLFRSVGPNMPNLVVENEPTLLGLFLSRSFDENLKDLEFYLSQYDNITKDQQKALPTLIQAIGKLLVLEQVKLRNRAGFFRNRRSVLGERLHYLRALSEMNYKFDKETDDNIKEAISDMIIDVFFYTKRQVSWGRIFRNRNARIASFSKPILRNIISDFYSDIMTKSEIKRHFKDILKKKKEALRGESGSWSEVSLRNIEIDDLIDQLPDVVGVISGEDFDANQAHIDALDQQAEQHSESKQDERRDLRTVNPMLTRYSALGDVSPTPPPIPFTNNTNLSCKKLLEN